MRALAIAEKFLGPDDRELAGVLYNAGQTLKKLGRKQEARILLARAEAIRNLPSAATLAGYLVDYRQLGSSDTGK